MLHIHYCKPCFEKLQSYGEMPLRVYIEIVESYIFEEEISFFYEDILKNDGPLFEVLKFLEFKGYLVSTDQMVDNSEILAIKPTGHSVELHQEHSFCHKNH
jgi:hypothetical protein